MSELPPPPPTPDEPGDTSKSSKVVIALVAVAAVVGVLALTQGGRDTVLPFLFGLGISLAIILAIPVIVGAVRAAGPVRAERTRRFWKGFLLALGIELVIVVLIGACLVIVQTAGGSAA